MEGTQRHVKLAVLVAALGYFVDLFDLVLFGVVRNPSLKELDLAGDELLSTGVFLLNAQMIGFLLGGIVWGILGDRRGRLSVLFASIFLYSLANLANAFVDDVPTYAVWRFVAGVGLAGELGAGVTLVSEMLPREWRGIGTTIIAAVGLMGALAAVIVGKEMGWRTAYLVGGSLGFVLMVLRVGVAESGLFKSVRLQGVPRGNFSMLFFPRERLKRYASIVLVALPIWYIIGVLVTFSPEIGRAMGMQTSPDAATAIFVCYSGLVFGDIGSGLLSQKWRSRKRVLLWFLVLCAVSIACYFVVGRQSLPAFYTACGFMGVAGGYWAVFMTTAAEQFGTNLRATATTTAPNFVRGCVVPLTWLFTALTGVMGTWQAAALTGVIVLSVSFMALRGIVESFSKDLDFLER